MANANPQGLQRELTTLIKRLEAATSRLEDIAISTTSAALIPPSAASPDAPALSAAPSQQETPSVTAFGELLSGPLAAYVEISKEIGTVVHGQALLVAKLFDAQRSFLSAASGCKKPAAGAAAFAQLLQPTNEAMKAVTDVREPGRERKFQNHLSTISEGVPALGWVTVEKTPGPYVKDMKESAEFYSNRVIKEYKESDPKQVEWARSFVSLLEELRKYIMAHHTTGLAWNANGVDATDYLASHPQGPATPAPPASTPAPPPPPPPSAPSAPPAPSSTQSTPKSAPAGDMSQVFAQLNRGEGVTTGLKKVDASQQTHKNPSLRATEAVPPPPASSDSRPAKPPKPASYTKRPPKLELDGTKWLVENYESEAKPVVITQTELGHTVNVFNCKSTVIQVKGKVNAVSLVNCSKVSVLVDSLVSALSITSSPSFTVQVTGKAPTITIDGTDGGQVYLSKDSLDVEIVTAKSTSINISLPVEGEEDGVFTEKPVPEQLKTIIKSGRLITTVVEHSG